MKAKTDDTAWTEFNPKPSSPSKSISIPKGMTIRHGAVVPMPEDDLEEAKIKRDKAMNELAKRLFALKARSEEDAQEIARMEAELGTYFPEEAGEISVSTENFTVTCNRLERWSWDKTLLEEIFNQEELPEWVTRNLSVDKRKFQKLPTDEREKVKPALTRKLNNPRIKVTKNV